MLSFEDATALHNHNIRSLLGDASPMGVPGWSNKLCKTRLEGRVTLQNWRNFRKSSKGGRGVIFNPIYPSERHNLPPTLEIIIRDFP